MRKCKVDEKKQTLDTKIYPVVRLGIKPLLLHVVEALYREYCFSATKSLPGPFLPRHHGLQVTTVTLASGSTKKLLHKGWGLHVPCTRMSMPLHTKPGSLKLPASHQDSKDGRHTEYKCWFYSRTTAQGTTPCSFTHSLTQELI